jgi:hypothetical protein
LAHDSSWVLVGVAVVLDALLASHRLEGRVIYAARRKHSFTLNEQHVTHVAAVLKGRPREWLAPRSQIGWAAAQ